MWETKSISILWPSLLHTLKLDLHRCELTLKWPQHRLMGLSISRILVKKSAILEDLFLFQVCFFKSSIICNKWVNNISCKFFLCTSWSDQISRYIFTIWSLQYHELCFQLSNNPFVISINQIKFLIKAMKFATLMNSQKKIAYELIILYNNFSLLYVWVWSNNVHSIFHPKATPWAGGMK